MAQAGHAVEVYLRDVVTAPVNPTHLIDGINKLSVKKHRDLLDTTDFKDTTGVRTRLAALKDFEATLSGDNEAADTVQGFARTALDNGTSVWLTYLTNPGGATGSRGFKVECLVEDESIDTSFDGKVEVSYSLKGTGVVAVDS